MDRDKSFHPLTQIDAWESRVAEIDESIRVQTDERVTLIRWIEAAKVIAEFLAPDISRFEHDKSASASVAAPQVANEEDSAAHEILIAVGAMKAPQKPVAIRQWINKNNPALAARLTVHPQYLYTVLTRHVRAGRLTKRGNRYRLPPSSPKKGAGGVVTPSDDLNHFTPNDTRADGTAPEAGGI